MMNKTFKSKMQCAHGSSQIKGKIDSLLSSLALIHSNYMMSTDRSVRAPSFLCCLEEMHSISNC